MRFFKARISKDDAGFIAALILAIACFIASVYHIRLVTDLDQNGIRVEAVVVSMERGARNSKWASYRYLTAGGQDITAKDEFPQYIKRVQVGQTVTVIYDRHDSETVTADLGIWLWQGPIMFVAGFVVLAILALLIWRHDRT